VKMNRHKLISAECIDRLAIRLDNPQPILDSSRPCDILNLRKKRPGTRSSVCTFRIGSHVLRQLRFGYNYSAVTAMIAGEVPPNPAANSTARIMPPFLGSTLK
jgi:hypothetical protein